MKNPFDYKWPEPVVLSEANGADLDIVFRAYAGVQNLHLVLKPGRYTTGGMQINPRIRVSGETGNREDVVIKTNPDTVRNNFSWPTVKLFAEKNWCHLAIFEDVTLDGNWDALGDTVQAPNFKLDAIVVRCTRGLVRNVAVRNCGANGKAQGVSGWECFPLTLQTFSSGPPWKYTLQFETLINPEDFGYVEVRDCLVEKTHFLDGGYGTCIYPLTTMGGQEKGDRMPLGTRETVAGRVINCEVRDCPGGIAYGTAHAENIELIGNRAVNCKTGFNFDTGGVSGLKLKNNTFLRVNQGVNLMTSGKTDRVQLEGNIIELTEPWFNPVLKKYADFYGFNRSGPSGSIIINNNLIIAHNHPNLFTFLGLAPGKNDRIYRIGDSAISAAVNQEIVDLKKKLADTDLALTNERRRVKNAVDILSLT